MLFKILLCFCLFQVVQSGYHVLGYWKLIASDKCVGSKGNHDIEFEYTGESTFIIAMKMEHKRGRIGCKSGKYTFWGCDDGKYPTNIIVTDTRNKRIYPSPASVSLRIGGWYDLPGYGPNSPELVFSDPGFRYLPHGQKMRIWYGEDLFNSRESNNHGFTCMDVHVFVPTV